VWKRVQRKTPAAASPFLLHNLLYFGLLGFAFLFIEIPLLQRFILYLGSPAYAVTAVLFALLLFSGVGSRLSDRLNSRYSLTISLGALALLCLLMPQLLTQLFGGTIGLPLAARLGVTVLALAPLGFLMGMPFPGGLRWLIPEAEPTAAAEPAPRGDIPWIWAVNGAASVIAPILAALLALSFGFSAVLRLGALCYAIALLTVWLSHRSGALRRPVR
jgi:MFS family permease